MPCSFDERVQQLKEAQRGWVHYFRLANIQGKLKEVDSWIRNRLRHCIWHDWKRPERKRKNLIRMGVPKGQAYAWSRTRKGGWAVAHSPMLITTVTVKRLAKRGYESLIDYYRKVAPQLNEPLYARPACTVVGEPHREQFCSRQATRLGCFFLKALYCFQLFLLIYHFFFQIIVVLEPEPEFRGVAKVVT